MMKRTVIAALLPLCLVMLVACDKKEPPKPSFGVVDISRIYQESAPGKAAVERLEKLQQDALARLEALQADVKAAEEAKDEAAVQRIQVEMQASLYQMQTTISAEQEKVVATLQAATEECLKAYRAEKGLQGLFSSDGMLAHDPAVNVTADVLAAMNGKTVDFGPVPSLETPAAPEAESQDNSVTDTTTSETAQPAEAEGAASEGK